MQKSLRALVSAVLFFACVSIASPSFAENQTRTIPFLGKYVSINFESRKTQDGEGVDSYITGALGIEKLHVDFYEPEGGAAPRIKSVFVDGAKPKRLFVIVAWSGDNPALDTGGSIYQVFVYDESVERSGTISKLHQDTVLAKRFGAGFDGVREGKPLVYKYKTAAAVKRQLTKWGYH
jgi:hypothetical protein